MFPEQDWGRPPDLRDWLQIKYPTDQQDSKRMVVFTATKVPTEAGQENTRQRCSKGKNLDKMMTMIMIGERRKRRENITTKKIKIVPILKKDLEIPMIRRPRKN